ncbi:MAG: hypothetical protein AAGH15_26225, partial [Myxococcota bacterium]
MDAEARAPRERYVLDAGQELAVGRFRLLAAVLVLPTSLLVLATSPALPLGLIAFAGVLVSVG